MQVFFLFEEVGSWHKERYGFVVWVGGVDVITGFEVTLEFDVEDWKVVREHAAKLNLFFQFFISILNTNETDIQMNPTDSHFLSGKKNSEEDGSANRF